MIELNTFVAIIILLIVTLMFWQVVTYAELMRQKKVTASLYRKCKEAGL